MWSDKVKVQYHLLNIHRISLTSPLETTVWPEVVVLKRTALPKSARKNRINTPTTKHKLNKAV